MMRWRTVPDSLRRPAGQHLPRTCTEPILRSMPVQPTDAPPQIYPARDRVIARADARHHRGAERRTARRRHPQRRAAARHRRRRNRQDSHARLSRRASHRPRRRAGAHPSPDVHAPRRARDDLARRATRRSRRRRACRAGRSTPPAIACCANTDPPPASRATSRSWIRATPKTSCSSPATTSASRKQEKRFPKKETLHYIYSRHLNTEQEVEAILEREYPQFIEFSRDIIRIYAEYVSRKGGAESRRLRRPAALLGDDARAVASRSPTRSPACTTTSSSTNTRTRISSRRACCAGCAARIATSPSSATTRRASIRFAARASETFSTSRSSFTGAQVVALEQNYRSVQPILDATNTLISRALERFTKNLWTERVGGEAPWLVTARDEQQQTRFVVDRILELHEEGTPLQGDRGARARRLHVGRSRDRADEPQDPVRQMGRPQVPRSGTREGRARVPPRARESARRGELVPHPHDAAGHRRRDGARDDGRDGRPVVGSGRVLAIRCRRRSARDAHKALARSAAHACGEAPLGGGRRRQSAKTSTRSASCTTASSASATTGRSRAWRISISFASSRPAIRIAAAFLAALALEPPSNTQDFANASDADDDALVISTVHSAKGKEWDAVFVIWAVDGWFPSSRSIDDEEQLEEERRLMYVAMTRARNHLAVTYPLNVYATRRGAGLFDRPALALHRSRRAREDAARRPEGSRRNRSGGGAGRAGTGARSARVDEGTVRYLTCQAEQSEGPRPCALGRGPSLRSDDTATRNRARLPRTGAARTRPRTPASAFGAAP